MRLVLTAAAYLLGCLLGCAEPTGREVIPDDTPTENWCCVCDLKENPVLITDCWDYEDTRWQCIWVDEDVAWQCFTFDSREYTCLPEYCE